MRALARLLLICGASLLQVAAANGHVLHHALQDAADGRSCHHHDDQEGAGRACELHGEAGQPPAHGCVDCLLCNESEHRIPRPERPQAPPDDRGSCVVAFAIPHDLSINAIHWLQPVEIPPEPSLLHAITLPLLN